MADPFPEKEVKKAWDDAEGKCMCMRAHNHATLPHGRALKWEARGNDDSPYGWEAHHRNANGPAIASNCEILCIECHEKTQTYGRPN